MTVVDLYLLLHQVIDKGHGNLPVVLCTNDIYAGAVDHDIHPPADVPRAERGPQNHPSENVIRLMCLCTGSEDGHCPDYLAHEEQANRDFHTRED